MKIEPFSSSFVFYFCHAAISIGLLTFAVAAQTNSRSEHFGDPESLVRHLYDQVTFPAGKTPDWNYVRTMFIDDATVVMRAGRDKTNILSLDGWILDFVNFIHDSKVNETGFQENVVKVRSTTFGDIAHVLVLYTSFIPGKMEKPREGVDSFHLIKKKGRWQIVSILNEIPTKSRPKPKELS